MEASKVSLKGCISMIRECFEQKKYKHDEKANTYIALIPGAIAPLGGLLKLRLMERNGESYPGC